MPSAIEEQIGHLIDEKRGQKDQTEDGKLEIPAGRLISLTKRLLQIGEDHNLRKNIEAGEKHAIASYGALSFHGNWVWRWKDSIDRTFMARYVI